MAYLVQIGTAVVLIGILLIFAGMLIQAKDVKGKAGSNSSKPGQDSSIDATTRVAVGGFFGPIPFGFANDKVILYIVMGLMIFTILVWFFLINYK